MKAHLYGIEAKGSRTPTASQQILCDLFALLSLPCVSKAASAAPKISTKPLAERCFAVFAEQHAVKTSKIPKGIPVGIFKGFCAVLAANCP